MNSAKNDLDRLLRSAAQAPGQPLVELDIGLQNRVLAQLAQLRATSGASRAASSTALWWRGALTLCAAAAVAVALTVRQSPVESQDPYLEAEALTLEAELFASN